MKKVYYFLVIGSSLAISILCSVFSALTKNTVLAAILSSANWIIVLCTFLMAVLQYRKNSLSMATQYLMELYYRFIKEDSLIALYKIADKDEKIDCVKHRYEIVQYLAFFDNLYLLLKREIVFIDDVDDTFSYYFYIISNNINVQNNILIPNKIYYTKIFLLSKELLEYRQKNNLPAIGERELTLVKSEKL